MTKLLFTGQEAAIEEALQALDAAFGGLPGSTNPAVAATAISITLPGTEVSNFDLALAPPTVEGPDQLLENGSGEGRIPSAIRDSQGHGSGKGARRHSSGGSRAEQQSIPLRAGFLGLSKRTELVGHPRTVDYSSAPVVDSNTHTRETPAPEVTVPPLVSAPTETNNYSERGPPDRTRPPSLEEGEFSDASDQVDDTVTAAREPQTDEAISAALVTSRPSGAKKIVKGHQQQEKAIPKIGATTRSQHRSRVSASTSTLSLRPSLRPQRVSACEINIRLQEYSRIAACNVDSIYIHPKVLTYANKKAQAWGKQNISDHDHRAVFSSLWRGSRKHSYWVGFFSTRNTSCVNNKGWMKDVWHCWGAAFIRRGKGEKKLLLIFDQDPSAPHTEEEGLVDRVNNVALGAQKLLVKAYEQHYPIGLEIWFSKFQGRLNDCLPDTLAWLDGVCKGSLSGVDWRNDYVLRSRS